MLSLKTRLEEDPVLRELAVNVVLQSRVKTAPSAFKKMVKVNSTKFFIIGCNKICQHFFTCSGRKSQNSVI